MTSLQYVFSLYYYLQVTNYFKGSPFKIGDQTPLEWWLEPARQATFPSLSKMAITIFSIPPMSAGPERVFSGAKHTLAPERIRLGAKMIEMAECLKSWVLITKGRDHAPLSGVFLNSKFVNKAVEVMEEEAKALAEGKAVDRNKVINLTVREAEVVREVV
jgi:hypothetical protein